MALRNRELHARNDDDDADCGLWCCVNCCRLAAGTEEKQLEEDKQLSSITGETAGKSYLKGDARLKRRSFLFASQLHCWHLCKTSVWFSEFLSYPNVLPLVHEI